MRRAGLIPNQPSGTHPEPMPRDHSERKTRPAMHQERSTNLALEGEGTATMAGETADAPTDAMAKWP